MFIVLIQKKPFNFWKEENIILIICLDVYFLKVY